MKKIAFILILTIGFIGHSQTKLIAHKSHSGSDKTFALAVNSSLFDSVDSNLGAPPIQTKDYVTLDSIVYVAKNKVVLIKSEYTQRYRYQKKCSKDELVKISRDTMTIKPKSNKNGLTANEVKEKILTLESYNNKPEEIIYSGFDEKSKRKKNKKSLLDVVIDFPNLPNSFFLIGLLTILSFLVYLIAAAAKAQKPEFVN